MYLLRRIAQRLGTQNLDHRLRRRDFRDQASDPAFPWLGCSIDELERRQAVLVVGSNLRCEAPLLAQSRSISPAAESLAIAGIGLD
jgi:NADH-quinone oxidoreductase subunit G